MHDDRDRRPADDDDSTEREHVTAPSMQTSVPGFDSERSPATEAEPSGSRVEGALYAGVDAILATVGFFLFDKVAELVAVGVLAASSPVALAAILGGCWLVLFAFSYTYYRRNRTRWAVVGAIWRLPRHLK